MNEKRSGQEPERVWRVVAGGSGRWWRVAGNGGRVASILCRQTSESGRRHTRSHGVRGAVIVVAALVAAAPVSYARNPMVTVNTRGDALVVETRDLVIKPPESEVRWSGISAGLDLDSVQFSRPGSTEPLVLSGLGVVYDLANRDALLRRYIGQTIRVVRPETGQAVEGVLAEVRGGRPSTLRTADGALWLDPGGEVVLPAGAREPALQPALTGRLVLGAARGDAAQPIRLSYRTGGIRWETVYSLLFNETTGTADLSGTMLLRNETDAAFDEATWRFVAAEKVMRGFLEPETDERVVEFMPLGGARALSVGARENVRLPLVDARGIRVGAAYVLDAMSPGGQDGGVIKLQRYLVLYNEADKNKPGLGVCLPSGKVKLSVDHGVTGVEWLGERHVGATAPDGRMEMPMGVVPGLTARRVALPFTELAGERSQEQQVKIQLNNSTTADARVQVVEHPWGRWTVPECKPAYEKLDEQTIWFDVTVPAGGRADVNYTLRIAY